MTTAENHNKSLRYTIQCYLIDCNTPIGKFIEVFILILNLLVCAIFVIETYSISEKMLNILWDIEVIIIAFFSIEYLARLYGSKNRVKYLYNIYSIIDLLSILPTLLMLVFHAHPSNLSMIMIIRVLRIMRIFRFLRYTANTKFFFGDISIPLLKVLRLVITILIIFFISSGLFWMVENPINDNVNTFGEAFYFTVVALTTVGFGDIVPLSGWGKAVSVLSIISGIVLIPWQASQIVREWMNISHKKMIICPSCGLKYHDKDASHCKSCGHVIYQEYDGF